MVYGLKNAGKTPTRAGLMTALKNLDPKKAKNPFLYPGVTLQTGKGDNFPLENEILVKWSGGAAGGWAPVRPLQPGARQPARGPSVPEEGGHRPPPPAWGAGAGPRRRPPPRAWG